MWLAEPSGWTLPVSAALLLKLKLYLCIIQLQRRALSEAAETSRSVMAGAECHWFNHSEPVSIRSRGLLTHGWRDRRRCTRRWSLCRCRTRQSGTSLPGCWWCWSEPRRTIHHNTCEGKRSGLHRLPRRCTARITDYLSCTCSGFTRTEISRLQCWCLKRNQDTSHME